MRPQRRLLCQGAGCGYLVVGNFGQALPSTTMPEETSEEERQALYQGVTDAAVAQLVAMSRDELAKYLRRHMHVVGPLPESRMELCLWRWTWLDEGATWPGIRSYGWRCVRTIRAARCSSAR